MMGEEDGSTLRDQGGCMDENTYRSTDDNLGSTEAAESFAVLNACTRTFNKSRITS
jgi:hypothetical protein